MPTTRQTRPQRIARIARRLAVRWHAQDSGKGERAKRPLKWKQTAPRPKPLIAYDLETTPIAPGNPRPLYLTAFSGAAPEFWISSPLRDIQHLGQILDTQFLVPEMKGARFVAWNGNKFDVYFIAVALLECGGFELRPYMTKSKSLRGLRVTRNGDKKLTWEFLDGLSMTMGSVPVSLKKFLKTFAPDYQKMDAPDWEYEVFDARNPKHVAYAERDSEGLWYGLQKAQSIVQEIFEQPLQPTIGNLGIRLFQQHLPSDVTVWEPPLPALKAIRNSCMRGGFCHAARKYRGPVWKYDINQAYAAAMRDSWLPSGDCLHVDIRVTKIGDRYPVPIRCAIYRISASNESSKVPFYYKETESGTAVFSATKISDAWITSTELDQLESEGWKFRIIEGYIWNDAFRMSDYVTKLERMRMGAPGGPKSAQGEMLKAIGNNSYGKTVETLDGVELIMAKECPEGFYPYQTESDLFHHIWFRFSKPQLREYHQPQIGCFITAHVRMVLRRAILLAPDAWIYADTDCAIFTRPVPLPIEPGKYGMWKIETDGTEHIVVTKKVHCSGDGTERHAKGLNVGRLKLGDFEAWFDGRPPQQTQTQRANFMKVMQGWDMFDSRTKTGQKIALEKPRRKRVQENIA